MLDTIFVTSQPLNSLLYMDFYSRIMKAERFSLIIVHVQMCLLTTNYNI